MRTYLSLDLDFFNARAATSGRDFQAVIHDGLEMVHRFARNFYIPVVAVMNHQQLLPFVDRSGCDRLLNVDTHSDLSETSVEELNCGTWVAYVKWRKRGTYVWWHGDTVEHGDCGGIKNMFLSSRKSVKANVTDWKQAIHIRNKEMPKLTSDIKAIGVCFSPMYIDFDGPAYMTFKKWFNKHGISYLKGRRNESFGRSLRPK